MKSESTAFLQKSRETFAKAQGMLARWPDEAGRAAYLAGLHAAQALIFEKTGMAIKRPAVILDNESEHRLIDLLSEIEAFWLVRFPCQEFPLCKNQEFRRKI